MRTCATTRTPARRRPPTRADGRWISCDSPEVTVGPPVSLGGIFGVVGGVRLGIGGSILGFALLLAGLIWCLVTREKV